MLHAAILQTNDKNNEIAEISVGSGLAKQDRKHEICKKILKHFEILFHVSHSSWNCQIYKREL